MYVYIHKNNGDRDKGNNTADSPSYLLTPKHFISAKDAVAYEPQWNETE